MEIYFGLRSKEFLEIIGITREWLGWEMEDGYKLCPLLSTEKAIPFLLSNKDAMKRILENNSCLTSSHYEEPNHGLIDISKLEIYEVDINPSKSEYQLRKRGEPKPKELK